MGHSERLTTFISPPLYLRSGGVYTIKPKCGERIDKAVFDTSILMLVYDGIPVFEEVERTLESKPECIVPVQVQEELRRLAEKSSIKKQRAAKLALKIIKNYCNIVSVPGDSGDDAIIEYVSKDCNSIAVTADSELRRRLREKGLPHIFYKAERRGLMLEG